ncbi:Sorting nexin-3 [Astathelohania contejeani]|uniref:Sorting nexin-3 n=1 Tax=Astathelohania contejeani TaxID=164912 RepID=A0ABQ7I2G8_9MICR|nr:Sorting nexin-3 [Thelohania contejeani]
MPAREDILEIYIEGHKNQRGFTLYEIVCITNLPEFKSSYFKIYRRYSQFLKLHNKIKLFIPILPTFPKKEFRKLRIEVILVRKDLLTTYLKYLSSLYLKSDEGDKLWKEEMLNFIISSDY